MFYKSVEVTLTNGNVTTPDNTIAGSEDQRIELAAY